MLENAVLYKHGSWVPDENISGLGWTSRSADQNSGFDVVFL